MNPFHSFRWKILGGFLTLFVAVLGASLLLVSRAQTRAAEERVRAQLDVTRTVFDGLLERRSRQLADSVALLGGDFAFKQAVATGDPATIASAAENLRQRIGAEALWVTDDRGRLYADTTGRFKAGRSIAELPVVASALQGSADARILTLKGTVYQTAAVPLQAPDIIGTLTAGFAIGDALAFELKRQTQSEVSFAGAGRVFASTLPESQRAGLEAGGFVPGRMRLITETGPDGAAARQLVLPTQPGPGVTVYLQRSWDEALEPLRRQQRLLLYVGLAGAAFTALFGFFLSEGVTASVAKLSAATRRIVRGDFSVRVAVAQSDEIGQLGEAFNRMAEGLQEREKIRGVLRKTVSKEIAEELLTRGRIELGGEERLVTTLFVDVRAFTTFAENVAPPEIVARLNEYFERMGRVVEANHGVIDKFIGDAVMALFGAPIETPRDADNALRAALGLVKALDDLNAERARRGVAAWRNGVGVNTGAAIAGTMGSQDRWAYTVVGDSVNLASRLEDLTKFYGVRIVLSGATRAAAQGRFLCRTLDLVRVKGRTEPVDVLELLGEDQPPPEWLGPYEAGVAAYRTGDFKRARAGFMEALLAKPDDSPSKLYLKRVEALLLEAPAGWEPAHTMPDK